MLSSIKMVENLSLNDFSNICLACLSKDASVDIFSSPSLLKVYTTLIQQKICEGDKIPKQICDDCNKKMDKIMCFIDTCKTSYNLLKSIDAHCSKKSEVIEMDVKSEEDEEGDKPTQHPISTQKEPYEDCSEINSKEKLAGSADENQCKFCSLTFSDGKILQSHLCNHKKGTTDRHQCIECLRTFATKRTLQIHKEKHGRNPFKCLQCRWTGATLESLNHHQVKHQDFYTSKVMPVEGTDKWQCTECKKQFTRKFDAQLHLRIHAGYRPHSCKLCDKKFTQKITLRRHELSRHAESRQVFECYICERKVHRKDHLEVHMMNVHIKRQVSYLEIPIDDEDDEDMPVRRVVDRTMKDTECTICAKSFSLPNYLLHHLEAVHGKVQPLSSHRKQRRVKSVPAATINLCPYCGLCFTNKKTFYNHRSRHHPTKESQTGLKKRQNATKENRNTRPLREFQCWHCGKLFHNSCNLVVHVRTHTGDKPYACSYCKRRFTAWNSRKEHENVHTGATPYKCEICGKAFRHRAALRKHRKGEVHKPPSEGELSESQEVKADG